MGNRNTHVKEDRANTNIQNKQLQIIEHYGMDKQLEQLIEECGELIVAISKFKRSKSFTMQDVIEEMADLENLIEQFKEKHEFIKDGVYRFKTFKVNRELDRIRG